MKKITLSLTISLLFLGISVTTARAATKYVTNSNVTVHKIRNGHQISQFNLPKYAVINKTFSVKKKGYVISSLYYPNKHYIFKSSGKTKYVVYADNFFKKYSSVKKHTTRVQLSHYPDNKLYTYEYKGAMIFIMDGRKIIKTAPSDYSATISLPETTKNKKLTVCVYNGKSQNFTVRNTVAKGVFTTSPRSISVSYSGDFDNPSFQNFRTFTTINGSLDGLTEQRANAGITFSIVPSVTATEKALKDNSKYVTATLIGSDHSSSEVKLFTNQLALN